MRGRCRWPDRRRHGLHSPGGAPQPSQPRSGGVERPNRSSKKMVPAALPEGPAGGRVVGEGGVHRLTDRVFVVGEQGLPPLFGLGGHPFTDRMQTCCLRGQVCGRILLRALFGGSPFGTGQPPYPLEVEGLGLGERAQGRPNCGASGIKGGVRDGEAPSPARS
ncbi:hypothetical protein SAVERM_214 [Streptomyces avermitilis MA-4680 = NBRC 14893]|uniref:Uncharacterized protein n=1 Tax=Streptomyces avermitilis (strain ATCC 31267 / DSM 46492 / JCM 5070 / NBRC 14893 / NCIMB 12804 / NRRL 8165 / MA-4680) TaxID=227882 RepID=Q82RC9_STRAW|nr:hypothetical protein SAVERM_214 [Streptomyces avermitilis MA-4680 = NBRC 14893]